MIPLKSVQLASIRLHDYGQNQVKLQFLPRLIAYLAVLITILSFVFYFNILGFALPELYSRNTTPESLVSVSKNVLSYNQLATLDLETEKVYQNINYFNSEESCKLLNQKSVTETLVFSSENQTFWLPQNCKSNLKFLQVTKLNPEDLVKISTNTNIEAFNIANNIYLLVYKNTEISTNLNFEPYLINLSQIIFPTEVSFIEATSFDLAISENQKFYMVGDCQSFEKNNCKIWLINSLNNTRKIIFSDFVSLLNKNQLPLKSVIRFAKIQDSLPNVLNLILYKTDKTEIILVRLSIENGLPVQELNLDKNTEAANFNKYYR